MLFGFVQVHLSEWLFVIIPSPISELQDALLPPKCSEPGSMPQLLTFPLFSPQTYIWVYQGAWECITQFQMMKPPCCTNTHQGYFQWYQKNTHQFLFKKKNFQNWIFCSTNLIIKYFLFWRKIQKEELWH